jgi:aspartate/methionine/tyrosine aminotransferase
MARAAAVRAAIAGRCRANLETLRGLAAAVPPVSVLKVGGGWSAVLRVPALTDDESLCLHLLESESVAVLPGAWFDFPRPGFLVLSLLPDEGLFAEGCRRLLRFIAGGLADGGAA